MKKGCAACSHAWYARGFKNGAFCAKAGTARYGWLERLSKKESSSYGYTPSFENTMTLTPLTPAEHSHKAIFKI
jgi:hypothetical protein